MNPPQRLYTAQFVALLSMLIAFGFSLSVFLLLPKFMKTELHSAAFDIGLVSSMFGVASVFALPFAGTWITRYGYRWSILVGNIVMATGALGFVLVHAVGALPLLLRCLHGLAWTMVFNAGMTLATLVAPGDRTAQAIGVFGSANLVTNAVAPAMAEPLIERFGYRPVFAAAAGIAGVACLLGRRLLEPGGAAAERAPVGTRSLALSRPETLFDLLRSVAYQKLLVVGLVSGLAFGGMFTFHQPFALALGMRNVRGFFIAYAIGAIAVRLASGRLVDRVGHRRIAVAALIVEGVVIMGTSRLQPGHLALWGGLFGITHGMFFPAAMALAVTLRPASRAQSLMLMSGAFAAGSAFVPLLGALADWVGYPVIFLLSGLAAVLVANLLPEAPPAT